MINRLASRDAADADLQNYLNKRPEDINAEISRTSADTAASRARFASGTSGIISGLAQRYNLPSDLAGSSAPAIDRNVQDLQTADREALAMQKVQARRTALNVNFSSQLDRLIAAGVDRTTAENEARQFALDQDRRNFEAGQQQKNMTATLKQQDTKDAFSQKMIQLQQAYYQNQRAQSLRNGLIRSLFGLGATIGTAYALGPAAAVVPAMTTTKGLTDYSMGGSSDETPSPFMSGPTG